MADINKLNGYDIRDSRVDSIASHITEIDNNIEDLTADKQDKITGGATTIVNDNLQTGRALISNSAGKVAVSPITSTELSYLDNVTSNVQTQLNGKQATVTGGASTVTSNNLTANRALISNADGKIAVSPVTYTELGYLDNVTSNVQTQLNSKIPQKAFITQDDNTDFNNLKPSGANEYRFDRVNITANQNKNQPLILTVRKAWNVVSFSGVNANYVWQTAYYIAPNTVRIFTRPCDNNAWGSWTELTTQYGNNKLFKIINYNMNKSLPANQVTAISISELKITTPSGYRPIGIAGAGATGSPYVSIANINFFSLAYKTGNVLLIRNDNNAAANVGVAITVLYAREDFIDFDY